MHSPSPHDDALRSALAESQRIGALGPQSIETSLIHARGYVSLIGPQARSCLDLGSGGGLPGLVIAVECRHLTRVVLLDRRAKRTDLLRRLVSRLGVAAWTEVVTDDAVVAAERAGFRRSFDVICARSFGTPTTLAIIAHRFATDSATLLVSEPPDSDGSRWQIDDISRLWSLRRVEFGVAELERVD